MELQVKDIERIWGNGRASLVAGRNGLTRKVDYYDMMEQPNMREWLREHLLLITTGYAIRNNKEALLQLIRDMNKANVSTLAPDLPPSVLQKSWRRQPDSRLSISSWQKDFLYIWNIRENGSSVALAAVLGVRLH